MSPTATLAAAAGLAFAGALLSAALIVLLRPWLARYALARPSARGLHSVPTPQGGGIAVVVACMNVAAGGAWLFDLSPEAARQLAMVFAAAGGLAVIGLIDDVRPIPALPRLVLQLGFMAVGVAVLPDGTRVLPILPPAVETGVLVVAGAWFVNLTNFMDGMDWMTVADIVPVTAALTLFWAMGDLPSGAGLVAVGLLGGLLGYAPFNKPVARLFLGDVGSLPIGFLVAYGLFSLAGQKEGSAGLLAAAILLPLYPIADSGITLVWRLYRGEKIWEPHRSHFYQTAVLRGATTWHVLARVACANSLLALFGWLCLKRDAGLTLAAILAGCAVVAATLVGLAGSKTKTGA